jgi:hypothetical protein
MRMFLCTLLSLDKHVLLCLRCMAAGMCTLTAQRRARSATKKPATRPARRNNGGGSAIDDIFDAINRNRNNGGGGVAGNNTGGRETFTQQTLRCNFGTISTPQEIRFTATGSTVGTFTNIATVTFVGDKSPKEARAPVEVVSCCAAAAASSADGSSALYHVACSVDLHAAA